MVFDRNSLFFASVSHFFKPKVRKYFDDAKTSCKYNNINKKFIISCTGTGIEEDTEQKKMMNSKNRTNNAAKIVWHVHHHRESIFYL